MKLKIGLFVAVSACVIFSFPSEARPQSFLEQLENSLRGPANQAAPPLGSDDTDDPGAGTESTDGQPYLGLVADDAAGAGVRVLSVKANGPAAAAGLKPQDLLVAVDNRAIASLDDLAASVATKKPGDKIAVQIVRDGLTRSTDIRLTTRRAVADGPADDPIARDERDDQPLPELPPPPTEGQATLGISISDVNQQTRLQYGLNAGQGAVVTSVRRGSPADRINLTAGAVIVAFDGRQVTGAADMIREMQAARPLQTVELTYYAGEVLRRSRVRLAADGPTDDTPPTDAYDTPRFSLPRDGQRRPILDRVERLIDELSRPDSAPGSPIAPNVPNVPPGDDNELLRLRSEVVNLRREMQQLQQQLSTVQDRLDRIERGDR